MKIGLILPNNVWFCPYVTIYSKLLTKLNIEYDIISWNRSGQKEDAIQYNLSFKSRNPLKLLLSYKKFASFVKETVIKNGYDRLIVFTPQSAIFLSSFLKRRYKNKYIFDYRDLSLEQKFYFKWSFLRVLRNSYANVISSPGFLRYLPKGFNYILSHNLDVDIVKESLSKATLIELDTNLIDVLTIGGIRDYESNVQIIEKLSNVEGFTVRFVGKGPSADDLQKVAISLNAKNISFEGYYPKEKESQYVETSTFLNIFYPRKASHDSALSNRFYNSLIYAKPMITTANTAQGYYAEKYNVGVALNNCENLPTILRNYILNMDVNLYQENRKKLLQTFISDYNIWESAVMQFLDI